ncbi:unnamed protein product [Strongylus vulgaris]|uniref:Uncharacterized protein n=1 Tax=Strongylus vulgaris TaxID=40348 RepID=A0A3P7J9K9_STRVU|nr:unnamed protein product [Strongylus vulgaris]
MARAGAEVRFEVRKGAALRNGLSAWLCQPPAPTAVSIFVVPSNRTSAFAPVSGIGGEPNRHVRSVSASDLYQSDPNASYSQRSVTGSTAGFDRLPAHYRHSNRPTVIQPGRPSASSPSALRRTQSPSSLYRPPSATNLFAPPRSPNPLQQQGYSSAGLRESNHDLYKASQTSSPPAAHSSPREEHRMPTNMSNLPPINTNYSASLPTPLSRSNYQNPSSNYSQQQSRNVPVIRYNPRSPSSPSSVPNGSTIGYVKPPSYSTPSSARSPEAAVVRPITLMDRQDSNGGPIRLHGDSRSTTTTFGVMAPTAFTQALQAAANQEARVVLAPPRSSGFEQELRNLERTNTALMAS